MLFTDTICSTVPTSTINVVTSLVSLIFSEVFTFVKFTELFGPFKFIVTLYVEVSGTLIKASSFGFCFLRSNTNSFISLGDVVASVDIISLFTNFSILKTYGVVCVNIFPSGSKPKSPS